MTHPLPAPAATGVGSLPGTDPAEAIRLVLGELPDLPHLPELPARGPGADALGRTAALLVGLWVDLQPSGWRMVPRPGRDSHRATDFLARDLDALQEAAAPHDGPLKLAVVGPWTLAAGLELQRGDKVLADHGAVADLHASLAEGVSRHVADVRRRLPKAQIVVQLDEPSLPAVLGARVPTASGYGTLRGVTEADAEIGLAAVLARLSGAPSVLHCCADDPPLALLTRLRPAGLSVDTAILGPSTDQLMGEAVEAGVALVLGMVDSIDAALPPPRDVVGQLRRFWQRLGFSLDELPGAVLVTARCGLAGASPAYAREAMAQSVAIAAALLD